MRWIVICFLVAAALPAAAFTQGGRAVVSGFQEPQSLHPLLDRSEAQDLIFAGLVAFDAVGTPYPDLALTVPTLENGGVRRMPDGSWQVEYVLREQVRWQNGEPVTASDVRFTWLVSRARPAYREVADVEVVDRHRARVRLKRAVPHYLTLFRHLLPEHQLSANPLNPTWWPMGAGPFRLQHWEKGDRITFLPHRDYHRGRPHLDQIQLLMRDQADADVRLGLTAYLAHHTNNQEPFLMPIAGVETLIFNMERLPDLSQRRGLVTALDLNGLLQAFPVPLAWSEQAPHSWGFNAQVVGRYVHDAEAARQAVSGLRAITLVTLEGRETEGSVASWLEQQWRQVGVAVTIHRLNEENLNKALQQGAFDVALVPRHLEWGPLNLWQWGRANDSRYRDPMVDRWLREMENTFSLAGWVENSRLVEARLTEDLPRFPLFYLAGWGAAHPRLQNFKSSPNGLFWNAYEWWKTP